MNERDARPTAPFIKHVAIIGCGFTGALQAINLDRHGGPRATIIDRSGAPGRGLAYSTLHPGHLLNVRAAKMSAFPDEPDHFVDWLRAERTGYAGPDFVPRALYGRYLQQLLDTAIARSNGRIRLIGDEAVGITQDPGRAVTLASGATIHADAVVLAPGNLPPDLPRPLEAVQGTPLYCANPWTPEVAAGLRDSDSVLLIGSGLTMVDVALLLDAAGFGGRILALSRRGLLPRRHHAPHPPGKPLLDRPAGRLSDLTHRLRARSSEIGWTAAVDELRPVTQAAWRNLTIDERRRFLRHLRPWWDVHRHRIAPEVDDRLRAMQASGQLRVAAGSLLSATPANGSLEVEYRPRGTAEVRRVTVRRIVNCTGPQGDIRQTRDPLLRQLLDDGMVRADPLDLGFEVNDQSQAIDTAGEASTWLYALGPITRGSFWEITAVPDIRTQTWNVARRFANAHWVGGEGL